MRKAFYELVKINNVSYNEPLDVLKEKVHLDMIAMVQNSRQFDMDRGPFVTNYSNRRGEAKWDGTGRDDAATAMRDGGQAGGRRR